MTATADLESLWYSHSSRIHAYIARHVYETDAIDDLVSSVYLRALVAIRNGNGYVTSASGWLYQIARSVIRDYWRAKKREPKNNVELDAIDDQRERYAAWHNPGEMAERILSPLPTPHEQVERDQVTATVRRAIARLPESQAMITTWRMCGYELQEIATALGKSYDAVKEAQKRAYSNLRQRLGEAA